MTDGSFYGFATIPNGPLEEMLHGLFNNLPNPADSWRADIDTRNFHGAASLSRWMFTLVNARAVCSPDLCIGMIHAFFRSNRITHGE